MILGTAEIDITPPAGVELSGFAARVQPSIGILDPLHARALYLSDGVERLLWLHCDLLGFRRELVLEFRAWASAKLGLRPQQVMLSATHTHSGPCTIFLEEAGAYDPVYVQSLQTLLRKAAEEAVSKPEPVEWVAVEGHLDLAVDRRQTVSAHTDPRVGAMGFRRANGDFVAVIANYAMHAVALGASNRCISADVPGRAALHLRSSLPGAPTVLVTNGACGNLNPPAENVSFSQIEIWGRHIGDAVLPLLQKAQPMGKAALRIIARTVPLALETLDANGVDAFAAKALQDQRYLEQWGDKYRRAVQHWRNSVLAELNNGGQPFRKDAELFGVSIGNIIFLGANAEVFSEFTDWLRDGTDRKIYFIGYANGDIGYLSTRAAYAEGGYEVEAAHVFYGGFRPKAGSLEMLADEAVDLLRHL